MKTLLFLLVARVAAQSITRANTCVDCATPGVSSFFDGCNTCTCIAGAGAACTKKACIAVVADPLRCENQCDGFLAPSEDGRALCKCKSGQLSDQCSKIGAGDVCSAVTCAAGKQCVPSPRACITTPCYQWDCVDATPVPTKPPVSKCVDCSTPGVTSYFDGCNTCSCGSAGGVASCTERACIQVVADPLRCDSQCDGFLAPSEDGSSMCKCKSGRLSGDCTKVGTGDVCSAVTCGAGKQCVPSRRVCVTAPCYQWDCVDATPVPTKPPVSKCVDCSTPGVTSFFDGCNSCTCGAAGGASGAICTKRACIALFPDPLRCDNQCDGHVAPSEDGRSMCQCKSGQLSDQCTKVGTEVCSAVRCSAGKQCVPNRRVCVTTPCYQWDCVDAPEPTPTEPGSFACGCNGKTCSASQSCSARGECVALPTSNWVADGAPFCVRGGSGRCCGDNFEASCGASEACVNGKCVADVKSACAPSPTAFRCGCDGKICSSSQSCNSRGECVGLPSSNWLADGAPFCVRGGSGRCCGDNFEASCGATEACVQGKCVADPSAVCDSTKPTTVPDTKTTVVGEPKPLPRTGKCFTCADLPVQLNSRYFDGCNNCSCTKGESSASCTELACIQSLPDPRSCTRQCDGFVTSADKCGNTCVCIGGKKTECQDKNGKAAADCSNDIDMDDNRNSAQSMAASVVSTVAATLLVGAMML